MAKITVNGLDEAIRAFGNFAKKEKMAIKAVDVAAPVLEKSLASAISSAADRGYATGELAASVSRTKPRKNEYGAYSVVKPMGRDEKGVRNVEKLAYLEYGTSKGKKNGQDPRPVRAKAVSEAKAECEKIMEETITEEIDKLW